MRQYLCSSFLIGTLVVATACSSSGSTVSTFERTLSKSSAASGASATAYYTLVETDLADEASVGVLVIDVSESIAARLRKDNLIPK